MLPEVRLIQVSREDVSRLAEWLRDKEVNASWYGMDEQGEPLHIGYSPSHILEVSDTEWEETFGGEARKIFSVLTADGQHIGEGQVVIETPLWEAQLFILIGRKGLWYRGYGTAGPRPSSGSGFLYLRPPPCLGRCPGIQPPGHPHVRTHRPLYWKGGLEALTGRMAIGTTPWLWGSCPRNTPADAPV